MFSEAAVDMSVEVTQAKVKYKGELLPRGEKFSEGLFKQLKELRVYCEDDGESLDFILFYFFHWRF